MGECESSLILCLALCLSYARIGYPFVFMRGLFQALKQGVLKVTIAKPNGACYNIEVH